MGAGAARPRPRHLALSQPLCRRLRAGDPQRFDQRPLRLRLFADPQRPPQPRRRDDRVQGRRSVPRPDDQGRCRPGPLRSDRAPCSTAWSSSTIACRTASSGSKARWTRSTAASSSTAISAKAMRSSPARFRPTRCAPLWRRRSRRRSTPSPRPRIRITGRWWSGSRSLRTGASAASTSSSTASPAPTAATPGRWSRPCSPTSPRSACRRPPDRQHRHPADPGRRAAAVDAGPRAGG